MHTPSTTPTYPQVTTKRPNTFLPSQPAKKLTQPLPPDLGKCIDDAVTALKKLGWEGLVKERRGRGDLGDLDTNHPATRLLKVYKSRGAPVKLKTKPWSIARIDAAMKRGPHKSCFEHLDFLQEEFVGMIGKNQWMVLPYEEVKHLPGLRLSPPGCIPQRDRRPRWICDYSYYDVNDETVELYAEEAMQFGHALERILREIFLADPKHGPVKIIKIDLADGLYRLALAPSDIPKLGVVFPTLPGQPRLVAFPMVLPMGWKNSPPIFCTATETVADLANSSINNPNHTPSTHPLSALASTIDGRPASVPTDVPHGPWQRKSFSSSTSLPSPSGTPSATPTPTLRDPSLPSTLVKGYVDVFVDDFIALAQGPDNATRVRNVLMHAIDTVFRPLDEKDPSTRSEPISMKKLKKGDCSWSTCKAVLGWLIDTTAMTISLPPHRVQRLTEILLSIPTSQKRIGVKKWHSILGELRSMQLALPGAKHLFSHMQLALSNQKGTRIALKKGVHSAIADFNILLNDIASRPTRIAELIPLLASGVGHHDASGEGAGGVWFLADHVTRRKGVSPHQPIVWRYEWPKSIKDELVTEDNPTGTISNSDLELAGGLLHLQALVQACDARERTMLSKTDNLAALFWQRKGSTSTDKASAHLLRLFGLHQRYHRYVPRHDYLSGPSNPLADASSRLFHLPNTQFLSAMNSLYPQKIGFQQLHLEQKVISSVICALQRRRSKMGSLLVEPGPLDQRGPSGKASVLNWPSIPYSKPSRTKYLSYRSLHNDFVKEKLEARTMPYALEQLRITYGKLLRRSSVWGTKTLV